eukprot:m.72079 g.72079  ORF g.72079 m.72079 type:complete len:128 (-) comp11726_c0_seq2:753-1136(-)
MAKEETKREAGDAEGSKNGETAPDDVVDEVEERKCDKWDFMKLSVLVDDIFAQELHSMFKDYARVEHLSNIKLGISIVALIVGIVSERKHQVHVSSFKVFIQSISSSHFYFLLLLLLLLFFDLLFKQ